MSDWKSLLQVPKWEYKPCSGAGKEVAAHPPADRKVADTDLDQGDLQAAFAKDKSGENPKNQINDLNLAICMIIGNSMKNYRDGIVFHMDHPLSVDIWKLLIDNSEKIASECVRAEFDASAQQAIDVIGGLPESARGAAAQYYLIGNNVALNAYQIMLNAMKQAGQGLDQYEKDRFEKVDELNQTVKDAVSKAEGEIKGGFTAI